MQAVVKQAGQLLRGVVGRKVGASHVADKQRVAREHREGLRRFLGVRHQNRDALRRVARRFQEAKYALPEPYFVAVADRDVRKPGSRLRPEINGGAGEGREFRVAGYEIRVQVGLDHVLDAQSVFHRVFDVDAHVALRVDHGGDAFRTNYVGGMRETSEIELLEVHVTHRFWVRGLQAVKVMYHSVWPYRILLPRCTVPVRAVICPCSCCSSRAAAAPR